MKFGSSVVWMGTTIPAVTATRARGTSFPFIRVMAYARQKEKNVEARTEPTTTMVLFMK